jgi:hypothetical protein
VLWGKKIKEVRPSQPFYLKPTRGSLMLCQSIPNHEHFVDTGLMKKHCNGRLIAQEKIYISGGLL